MDKIYLPASKYQYQYVWRGVMLLVLVTGPNKMAAAGLCGNPYRACQQLSQSDSNYDNPTDPPMITASHVPENCTNFKIPQATCYFEHTLLASSARGRPNPRCQADEVFLIELCLSNLHTCIHFAHGSNQLNHTQMSSAE